MCRCDVLFVASNLNVVLDRPEEGALPERSIDGLVHRVLDPTYYAWLCSKIDMATRATDAHELSPTTYDNLLTKFDGIHRWATKVFGKQALQNAMDDLNANSYRGPSERTLATCLASVHRFPKDGTYQFSQPVLPKTLALVDGIAEEALALGWTKSALYQNRSNLKFPFGKDWGLVCFIHEGDRLGIVTSPAIEIIGSALGANPLKFYNPFYKAEQLGLFSKGGPR